MKHGPPAPPAAAGLFGERLELARRYADLLADAGVERGLLGPREVDRLWERHILNCAAVVGLLGQGWYVVDIGSGAGLPGIPVAIARPDLTVTLVEPLLRRADFLNEAVATLGIEARVLRGRAEDPDIRNRAGGADAVLSRAVAGLDKLARWSLPLLKGGGVMLALKGERAEAEISESIGGMTALGATDIRAVRCGSGREYPATTVVTATRGDRSDPRRRGRPERSRR